MRKLIVILVFVVAVHGYCDCNKFQTQITCDAYFYCGWNSSKISCELQNCPQLNLSKCVAPLCSINQNSCIPFSSELCTSLEPQQCQKYWSCYYDYTKQQCGKMNTCENLSIDQCNGLNSSGQKCVVDPVENTCTTFKNCGNLNTEFACSTQYPECSYMDNQCKINACNTIQDRTSCRVRNDCLWSLESNQCQELQCNKVEMQECHTDTCGWEQNECQSCQIDASSVVLIVSLLLLVF